MQPIALESQYNAIVSKTFYFENKPHYEIIFRAILLEIDLWGPSILQLQINSILALELTPNNFPQNPTQCGSGYSDRVYNLNYLFQPHDNENLLVEFKTMGASGNVGA